MVGSLGWLCRCVCFSGRRRHTSYWRDWSSDVCSSDLQLASPVSSAMILVYPHNADWDHIAELTGDASWSSADMRRYFEQIGRASCRERVEEYVHGVILNGTDGQPLLRTKLQKYVDLAI